MRRIILVLLILITAGTVFCQTKRATRKSGGNAPVKKTATTKAAASKAVGAWVSFNGGEFVKKIAVDSKNTYVCMMYTKRLVAIDKATGKMQEIKADHEISGLAVAADKCYYYVVDEGIYRYDSASGTSEGPLFGVKSEWSRAESLESSQDGRYLLCGQNLIDLSEGSVVTNERSGQAVNNLGGVYSCSPEAWYTPLGEPTYQVSRLGSAIRHFFPDVATDNVYYCTSEGLSVTPMVPQPESGLKKVQTNFESDFNVAMFITRDDDGNFVVSTNFEGIGFGGKSIEDPFRMEKQIDTGISVYGMKRYFSCGDCYITSDGNGNLIFGPDSSSYIFIYNPKGINGYTELKGKIVQFDN